MNWHRPTFLFVTALALTFIGCSPTRHQRSEYDIRTKMEQTSFYDKRLNGKSKISGLVYSRTDSTFLEEAIVFYDKSSSIPTNDKGEFSIDLAPGKYILTFRYLGHNTYVTKELKLNPNEHLIIHLRLGTSVIE